MAQPKKPRQSGMPHHQPLTVARSMPVRRASDVTTAMKVNDPKPYNEPTAPPIKTKMEHPPNVKRMTLHLKKP